ncbi:hypothetical protein [Rubrivirga sp. IMCC43871]|uniref:hypothetical protein n=1 Tax=Rubrivirga sp. IMCC43871 TaxID=3391575 RepID=UPI00398FDE06
MRPLLLFMLAVLVVGCDAGASRDLAEGTFTLRLDGAPAQTRTGAFTGAYVRETGPATAVLLGTNPIATALGLSKSVVGFVADREALTVGRYPLTAVGPGGDLPDQAVSAFYLDPARYDDSARLQGFFFATEGQLTIDAVEADGALRGTYAITATEYDNALAPVGDPVRVSGAFHAEASDAFGDEDALLSRRAGPRLW